MALVLVLAIYLVYTRFAEAQQVIQTLQQGHYFWLGLAALTQLVWLVTLTATYRQVYRLLGMDWSLAALLPLVATANFVNTATPAAGAGGIAVYVSDARRRGYPAARVTVGWALTLLIDQISLLCVLALGLVVLLRRHQLDAGSLGAAAILFLVALVLASLLALGARSAQALANVLVGGARLVNRVLYPFLHRAYVAEARASAFASELADGLSALRAHWSAYLGPVALGLLSKGLMVVVLLFTFLAFSQPFSLGTLVAGYSICYLFVIVSPTPAGLGFVEGLLPLTFMALGVPKASAVLITFAYRGLTFWFPFGYGFIAFRVWSRRGKRALSL